MSLYHETYDVRAVFDAPLIGDHAGYYLRLTERFGGPVLELGAGTARISRQIAASGTDATALEICDEMIEAGNRWGQPAPADRFRMIRGDVRKLPRDRRYALVIAPFRMLQELESDVDVVAALREALAVLQPGGLLCFDLIDIAAAPALMHPDPSVQQLPDIRHPETGNRIRVSACERLVNADLRQYREKWLFEEVDAVGKTLRRDESWQVHRWYHRQDMARLLHQAGCGSAVWYGSFRDLEQEQPRRPGRDQIWLCQSGF
ncbi:MAG: class I SAM-dependent methyltransferase [Rhodospirillales bacterium]